MESIKERIIRESTPEEHDFYIGLMEGNVHDTDPKVGIFWYNPNRNELFGVVALSLDDPGTSACQNGLTSKILHKDLWKKELRRLKYKDGGGNTFPYIGRYEDKPRGRVFMKGGKFHVTVGNWIKEGDNYRAIDLVEEQFNLTHEDVEVVIDNHWDIGCGWDRLC